MLTTQTAAILLMLIFMHQIKLSNLCEVIAKNLHFCYFKLLKSDYVV